MQSLSWMIRSLGTRGKIRLSTVAARRYKKSRTGPSPYPHQNRVDCRSKLAALTEKQPAEANFRSAKPKSGSAFPNFGSAFANFGPAKQKRRSAFPNFRSAFANFGSAKQKSGSAFLSFGSALPKSTSAFGHLVIIFSY